MTDLQILELVKEIYHNDLQLHTEYGNELVSYETLDGEYKILRAIERAIDEDIIKMSEEREDY